MTRHIIEPYMCIYIYDEEKYPPPGVSTTSNPVPFQKSLDTPDVYNTKWLKYDWILEKSRNSLKLALFIIEGEVEKF